MSPNDVFSCSMARSRRLLRSHCKISRNYTARRRWCLRGRASGGVVEGFRSMVRRARGFRLRSTLRRRARPSNDERLAKRRVGVIEESSIDSSQIDARIAFHGASSAAQWCSAINDPQQAGSLSTAQHPSLEPRPPGALGGNEGLYDHPGTKAERQNRSTPPAPAHDRATIPRGRTARSTKPSRASTRIARSAVGIAPARTTVG